MILSTIDLLISEIAQRVASNYGHPGLAQKLERVANERISEMLLEHLQEEMEFLMNYILDEDEG